MNTKTIDLMYADFLHISEQVDELLHVLEEKKPGTVRAARKNLEIYSRQMRLMREALEVLGYTVTSRGLVRTH